MICLVCGKHATGVHYGVLACEGCKAFFKRGVEKKIQYTCCFGKACPTDAKDKLRCKACRFQKCVQLGMKMRALPDQGRTRGRRKQKPKSDSPSLDGNSNCTDISTDCQIVPDEWSNDVLCLPDLQIDMRRLSGDLDLELDFMPFNGCLMGDMEANRRQIAATVNAVGVAAQMVFGDQILYWTACRDEAFLHEQRHNDVGTSVDDMTRAINQHHWDNVFQIQKFASLLPGMQELEPSARGCIAAGWKFLVFWMIHHAPFLTNTDTFITVGPKQLRYRRAWQEAISETPLWNMIYKFCNVFRELGLSQTERFLLMAVVIFEPGEDFFSHQSLQLQMIHRHYTDALMDVLKRRCANSTELAVLCRKLEKLFGDFKFIYELHKEFFSFRCPRDFVEAKVEIVRLQVKTTIQSYPGFHPSHPIVFCTDSC